MDLYMTEKETGSKIALALLPDSVKTKVGANVISYNFISVGEVKIPSGQKLRQFSWSGTFPGKKNSSLPFVKSQFWMPPKTIINTMENWRKKGTRIILMLTETPLNCATFLSSFEHTFKGGLGDVQYSLTFTEYKPVGVYTLGEVEKESMKSDNNIDSGSRPASQTPGTETATNSAQASAYTTKFGDSVWKIAQEVLGDGSRYEEIREMNRDVLINDGLDLPAGMVLVLPSS